MKKLIDAQKLKSEIKDLLNQGVWKGRSFIEWDEAIEEVLEVIDRRINIEEREKKRPYPKVTVSTGGQSGEATKSFIDIITDISKKLSGGRK
jgi:tRNA A37 threonylcarbamoyladenosine biosynthesis protein TsaE